MRQDDLQLRWFTGYPKIRSDAPAGGELSTGELVFFVRNKKQEYVMTKLLRGLHGFNGSPQKCRQRSFGVARSAAKEFSGPDVRLERFNDHSIRMHCIKMRFQQHRVRGTCRDCCENIRPTGQMLLELCVDEVSLE